MEQIKKETNKEGNGVVPEMKKSKITLYWEKRERLGAKGKINNMRAILK